MVNKCSFVHIVFENVIPGMPKVNEALNKSPLKWILKSLMGNILYDEHISDGSSVSKSSRSTNFKSLRNIDPLILSKETTLERADF